MKLSVAIATYNEEKKLGACLASVSSWVDEIVVVDGGSMDQTLTIARKYNARITKTGNPAIFHLNKQKALDACRGEWILQLDADEVVTSQLRDEILAIFSPQSSVISPQLNGYYIPRKNFFWGHLMKKGGQYPDYVIRLVRNGKAWFPCNSVHEQIKVNGEVGYLNEPLEHYAYRTKEDYWKKADVYTSLTARSLHNPSFLSYVFIKPIVTFFSLYIRHKGFMDGLAGFKFALYSALHHPMAYAKFMQHRTNTT